ACAPSRKSLPGSRASPMSLNARLARAQAELRALRRQDTQTLQLLREDPARLLSLAGMGPDGWQADLLRSGAPRVLMLCTRQGGKSLTAAGLALREALLTPASLVLLLSPTLRQSGELFRDKVLRLYGALGRPVPALAQSALRLELANGSRIVSLPGD